jgi:tripartite-type tricarboxylate transporter receptor subunit TctC
MKLPRRDFLRLAAGAAALSGKSRIATAQTYPSRPITMIVPFPAGFPPDAAGRVLAERMRDSLGQPIIIENGSGADGSIATGRAARASPDGYTIELGVASTHVLNSALYSLRYDVLDDFSPVSPLFTSPFLFVARKTMPAKDLIELIAWLKANPGKASAAIVASYLRVAAMLFQRATGTHFVQVPYRGSPVPDLLADHIDLAILTPTSTIPLARAGRMKAYAATSDTRLPLAPDIPTFAEMGLPQLSLSYWGGLFAPRGTSKEIIGRLNTAVVEALADPVVRSHILDLGMEIFAREQQTPEHLAALQKADAEKWWPLIKEFGIRAE